MISDNGRTLDCPVVLDAGNHILVAKDTAEMIRKKGVRQFLHSFDDLKQISLLPPGATANPQSGKVGVNGLQERRKDLTSAQARPPLFETSQVLFNPPSEKIISKCFRDGRPGTSNGSTRIHLGAPSTAEDCTGANLDALMDPMIAIKPVWAVTVVSYVKGVSYPIPVWVPSGPAATTLEGIPGAFHTPHLPNNSWSTVVRVALPSKDQPDVENCDPGARFEPQSPPGGPIVPLSCFYSLTITAKEWDDYLKQSGLPPHQTTVSTSNDTIYVILMGFHVITKEIPEWTWQTFWWNWDKGGDLQSPYQGSQSPDPRWSHYVSSVTYGPPDPKPDEYKDRVVFNPFLESPLPNGINSNCFTCHSNARYNSDDPVDRVREGQFLALGVCQPNPQSSSPAGRCDAGEYDKSGVSTHFLWSLADSNAHPEGTNLLDPRKRIKELDSFLMGLEKDRQDRLNAMKKKVSQKK
jgi:hypothetical protein